VGGVDVRGGAPGTINTDGLRPGTVTEQAQGILLTGGSTFGLSATAGVLRYLEERGIGLDFGSVAVPIVAGAVIFDLLAGDPTARPGPEAGYAACEAATASPEQGAVGAGTGASVAKAGGNVPRPGGVGLASAEAGGAVVAAVMVANSLGGIWDDDRHEWVAPLTAWDYSSPMLPGGNTTIGAVVTDAVLTKEQATRVAAVAHDGIARAVRPAHTLYDGDTMFCLATGAVQAPLDAVEAVAAQVVARAIAAGVRAAEP
jgi:L-aminopeptidase/D-esterase-like protein